MRTAGRTFALLLLLATVGCDRVTKHVATTMLAGKPSVSYLADTFRLEYAENPGAFMSMGRGLPDWARIAFLTVGAGVGLLVVAVAAFRFRWIGLSFIGGILFISGGASNLIDRIAWGSVVDLMNVGLGPLRTGIFNVADVALVAGVVLIVMGVREKSVE